MNSVTKSLAILAILGFLGSLSLAQDKPKDKDDKGKPNVVQIDLSKLPPEVAKKVLEALQAPAATPKAAPAKIISLVEAIGIAEKTIRGEAVKAERKGEGAETHFKIEVLGKDGKKAKLELSGDGKPLEKKEEKKP
jgi:uncharacterized membrane protein YkoI